MRESQLKKRCRDWAAERFDGRMVNVDAKGVLGFPDSILLVPQCPPVLIEFKTGTRPSSSQVRWGQWLSENGFRHWTVYALDEFIEECENLFIDRGIHRAATFATARSRRMAEGQD